MGRSFLGRENSPCKLRLASDYGFRVWPCSLGALQILSNVGSSNPGEKGHLSARDQQSELDVQLQVPFDPGLHTGSFPGSDAQNLLVHRVCPGNSGWKRG